MSFIDELEFLDSQVDAIIHTLSTCKKKNYILGTGVYSYVVHQYLDARNIPLAGFMISDEFHSTDMHHNLPVVPLSKYRREDENLILGTPEIDSIRKRHPEIVEDLKIIDVPDFLNIPHVFFTKSFLIQYQTEFTEALNCFEDDLSKRTFIASVNAKITGNPDYLYSVTKKGHLYFSEPTAPFSTNEILLDVGAFDGDSVTEFHQITSGEFDQIISLEPFETNYSNLCRKIFDLDIIERVKPIMIGAWDSKKTLGFEKKEKNIDNKINDSGELSIQVDKIDKILSDLRVLPSIIKMDINGAEYRAIKGALETIATGRPRLVTKIHTKEDYYRIPLLLKNSFPEIKLYLRQKNYMSMMLVLHAKFN